jgi:cytochrome c551/c552
MRTLLTCVLAVTGALAASAAWASPELSKKAGCATCHAVDKKKEGPAFQETAKKLKADAGAEEAMFRSITEPKTAHPEMKASPEEIKAVLKWVKTL